jgi:hypothetical protein
VYSEPRRGSTLMSKDQNDEVSDTTDDAQGAEAGKINILITLKIRGDCPPGRHGRTGFGFASQRLRHG